MKSKTKNCQNCKKDFIIEPDDFGFYEKIKVPPPTFCPECRRVRRFAWRNERTLYKRNCDLCKKSTISMYHTDVVFSVYCRECWWGDSWEAITFEKDYDFSRPFFEQFKELLQVVPCFALFQVNSINSDYSNMIGSVKNAYLSVSAVRGSENVFYSKCVDNSKDIIDCLNVINGSESLYENVEAQSNYNSQYLLLCRSCIDSYYLVDCVDCSNCFLSYNLRSKKYCIKNIQYTKEDYFKELVKLNLKSRASREALSKEFEQIKKLAIYRFGNINKCVNVTGNNLLNAKNSKDCFEVYNMEDSRYCFRGFNLKDCFDFDFGGGSELMYEYITGASHDYNVRFAYAANSYVQNAEYVHSCINSKNIFGCVGLKNKEYAILNKIYSKEEFAKLREKIIKHMEEMPYIDVKGRVYKYGEFFPMEISPFAYNESPAQEVFPITEEEAKNMGYYWRKPDPKNFNITIPSEKIPDNIDDVDDKILKEVLGCAHEGSCDHQCNIAFRLTDYEFKFYKKHEIPLPVLCSNCRYYERCKVMPALKLWHRKCMKDGCQNEFETAYAPDRKEKIYCEKCYQQEVY